MALYSLTLLGPSLYRIKDLLPQEREHKTYLGQLSTLSALFCPVLWVSHALAIDSKIGPLEWISICIGFVITWLQQIQDGRVNISSPEIAIYWIFISVGYLSYSIDSVLRLGWYQSFFILVAALLSIITLIFELRNPERKQDGSYEDYSLYEKATMSLGNRTMKTSQSRNLSHFDFPSTPFDVKSHVSKKELQGYYDIHSNLSEYRILLALKDMVGYDIFISGVLFTFMILLELSIPQFMTLFLRSLLDYKSGKQPLYKSYYFGILVSIPQIAMAMISSFLGLRLEYCRSKSRSSLTAIVFQKSLSLDPKSRELFDTSKLMNFVSVDINEIVYLVQDIPLLLIMPSIIPYALWQLWSLLGPTFLFAALVYVLLFPCQSNISKRIGVLFPNLSSLKDNRNKLLTNVITCIKSLKFYSWEVPFFKNICSIRERELNILSKTLKFRVVLNTIYETSSSLVSTVVFLIYLWTRRGPLTADIVFPAIFLLENVSVNLMMIPDVVMGIQKSLNSQARLNELLSLSPCDTKYYEQYNTDFSTNSVVISEAKISWNGDSTSSDIALDSVSLEASKGDLICVIGRVGSGKTAFLRAIANDLCILEGNITVTGSIAICTQSVWLENTTIRENILFGESFNENWYQQVLKACVLDDDLATFSNNDLTCIGERGATLSGGQRARVALARAVYSRADIYLLDDVLSAVDEHVGASLIDNLFSSKSLLANRTIIFATNNMKVLSYSSKVLALKDKRVAELSSVKDILQNLDKSLIFNLVHEFGDLNDIKRNPSLLEDRKQSVLAYEANNRFHYPPTLAAESPTFEDLDAFDLKINEEVSDDKSAGLEVFLRYFFLSGRWLTLIALIVVAAAIFLDNFVVIFLGKMTSYAFMSLYEARTYISLYFLLIILNSIITVSVTGFAELNIALKGSKILHERMIWSILRAPMEFFNMTPIGKIINRFTNDISEIEDGFADVFMSVTRSLINLFTSLLIIVIGSPAVLLIICPMAWFANQARNFYVPSRRKVTRHFEAANSPILSQVENTLEGRLTIRSFGRLSRYVDIFEKRVDYRIKTSFFLNLMRHWLNIRISALSTILSMTAAVGVTQLIGAGKISVSYAGVVLKFSEGAKALIRSLIENLASAETSGISLERIFEFIDLPSEASDIIEATNPEKVWPVKGELFFKNFSTQYSSGSPLILRNLNFQIKEGEKIAIVGRTGSGKSSLALSLFRILEATKGSIEIDGLDISILGLSFLRSHISAVPQDAHVFDLTLRDNLDPEHKYSDAQLWEALDQCRLKDHLKGLGDLNFTLKDANISLSHGQCQLLCLCRAFLRKSKLLVLDEATASLDIETEKLIQKIIRSSMYDRTVITVAHRLDTVMDSDRVMVLEDGEIKEFDTPQRLLELRGLFFTLLNAHLKSYTEQEK